jgi:hypothetical protein
MRLIHTRLHRHPRRGGTPPIAISQAEITADLLYPGPPAARREAAPARRGRR